MLTFELDAYSDFKGYYGSQTKIGLSVDFSDL